jgi:lipoprotein NlpI
MRNLLFTLMALALFAAPALAAEGDLTELLQSGHRALLRNDLDRAADLGRKALALAEKEVASDGKNARPYFHRGLAHELLGQHKEAVADFGRSIERDPKEAEAYDHRGSEQFKLGHINESLADFDRYLKLRPEAYPHHWKRGISLYYAGKYDEGCKQFKGYEKVDANDVENAVWHFLCAARKDGAAKARAGLLKIGQDRRVPMMQVHELFAGKIKPADVLKATEMGKPSPGQLNTRLFYAHLYLGLYYEALGKKDLALKHLSEATDKHRIGHYMWDVARVARNTLSASMRK